MNGFGPAGQLLESYPLCCLRPFLQHQPPFSLLPPLPGHSVSVPAPTLSLLSTSALTMPDDPHLYMDCTPPLPPDILLQTPDVLPVVHTAHLTDPLIQSSSPPCSHISHVGEQCNLGANISATPDLSILINYTILDTPFNLLGADATVDGMLCPGFGFFPLTFTDGSVVHVKMYYCPHLLETLLSPQHICTQDPMSFVGFDIQCKDLDHAFVCFYRPPGSHSDAPLHRTNNLFYFTQLSFQPKAHRLSPLLSTELWHQRLGHPGMHQLQHLQQCSTGLPSGLHHGIHPLHTCKICCDARARKTPRGLTSAVGDLLPGSCFHLDFGFMRASSDSYKQLKGATRVVSSYDGYSSYLLITDAKTRYTWVFLTASKDPPVAIVQHFLTTYGLTKGYRALCLDQGGELWRSDALRTITDAAHYVMEPTGSDCPHQNGKVERLNGTFGIMVRALLYSSGLPPKYWSAALVHAVYLKNRLWHSALTLTPFEAWTGDPPDLSHLRVFGSLLTARIPGARPAKLDRQTYDGIFLGYTSSPSTVTYIDVHSGRVKTGGNFIFDEAHYTSTHRPPGPQFLFDLGLHTMLPPIPPGSSACTSSPPVALMPPLPTKPLPPLPSLACLLPLPFGELTPSPDIALAFNPPLVHTAAALTAPEALSIEFSGDPFGPSFCETVSLSGSHVTAGFHLTYDPACGRLHPYGLHPWHPCCPHHPMAFLSSFCLHPLCF